MIWYKPRRKNFKGLAHRASSSKSSSEVGSDEDYGCSVNNYGDGVPMDLDPVLGEPVWNEAGEETEPEVLEDLDAGYTSSVTRALGTTRGGADNT